MQIGLLLCDHVDERFQHILTDYPDAFQGMFDAHAPGITLKTYDVCHGEWPEAPDECDGYIISGSRYSVYDEIDWIQELAAFVRRVHDDQRKMVGICFGHQMIAQALGGKVEKAATGWGVGIKAVDLQSAKPWMQPGAKSYHLLLSHQDQVLVPPDGAEILGGNAHCPVSMFAVGQHLLGIQAHPEFSVAYAQALLDERIERVGAETAQAAQASFSTPTDSAIIARWIAAFLRER